MNKTITLEMLVNARACDSQVRRFKRMFGEEVVVTQKLCRSVADKFDWWWASRNLLSNKQRAVFNRPVRAHERSVDKEYRRLRKEHDVVVKYDAWCAAFDNGAQYDAARKEYERATVRVERGLTSLSRRGHDLRAVAFAKAYNS